MLKIDGLLCLSYSRPDTWREYTACHRALTLYLIYKLHRALHQNNRKGFNVAQNGILTFVLGMKCDLKYITFLTRKSNPSPLTILWLISNKPLNFVCGTYDLFNFDRHILILTVASPNSGSVLKGEGLTFVFEALTADQRDKAAPAEMSTSVWRR